MKRNFKLFACLFLSLSILAGCSQPTPTVQVKSDSSKSETSASSQSKSSNTTKKDETSNSNSSSNITTSTAETVYQDNYIQVTKNGGSILFKNLTDQDIVVDGEAILNNAVGVNMYSFGFVGEIVAHGSSSDTISSLEIEGQVSDKDTDAGETLGGDKLYKHIMQKGDTLTWSGKISDSDYNDLASVSFTFDY